MKGNHGSFTGVLRNYFEIVTPRSRWIPELPLRLAAINMEFPLGAVLEAK
jgi:hypothetical protein